MKVGALLALALGLWFAAALQQALAYRMVIFGAMPDFILVFLAASSPRLNRVPAAWNGFAAGVVQGAVAGANLTHYTISRTITSFLLARLPDLRLESGIPLAAATAFFTTLVAQVIFMFLAAPRGILSFLGATMGSALFNGVLVIPVFLVIERVLGGHHPKRRQSRKRR